jgi:copper chaperone CopZ
MMCNHCKANVEKALANIKGVTAVRVELAEGRAIIDGENFSAKEIIDTIRELGYEYIEE